jgi:hypothetical protein
MYPKGCALQIRFQLRTGEGCNLAKLLKSAIEARKPNSMKIHAVQKLHARPDLGYLPLYKHLTYCHHSNIIPFAQVVQQVT